MSEDQLPEQLWTLMQQRLGYSDQELEQFKANPRNLRKYSKRQLCCPVKPLFSRSSSLRAATVSTPWALGSSSLAMVT